MKSKTPWHSEVVPERSWKVLDDFFEAKSLISFYLAGGTGLALMLGHRRSHDFDFFSKKLFDESMLIQELHRSLRSFSVESKAPHTLHIDVDGVKVTFLGYNYPLLFPTLEYNDKRKTLFKVADLRDIACMKIDAIASRGSRRDFIDLYAVSQIHPLPDLLEFFDRKYSGVSFNRVHVLKSLTYFSDAESDPMPEMMTNLSWEEVKNFFLSEVPRLLRA